MVAESFDVIVIGGGPGAEVLAGRMAKKGYAIAIVESELVGGECAYYACMPSKALLRPAQALAEARRVPGAAEAAGGELDVAAVLRRRDEVIHELDDSGQVEWLDERGVALIRGRGRLDGERQVRVGEKVYEARRAVVIAVGSSPVLPPIPGLAEAKPWTNRAVTTAERVPERLIVLGAGAVGVEMADAYATLGSSVALVEALDRLVPNEEEFAGEQLREAFVNRGIDVRVGVRAERVERDGGVVRVQLSDQTELAGNELLVAVGRRARSEELGLETVGLKPEKFVQVDDRLRVDGLPWLYAIGDANGRSLLTHVAKYQAHALSEMLDGNTAVALEGEAHIPRVVFTEPQLAAVGLTLSAARERGFNARAYDVSTSGNAGASFYGRNTEGTSRIVVDEGAGVLVGATFTGTDVAEWIHAATIAIVSRTPIERLWQAIPAFPTRSEVWLKLLERRESELAEERADRGSAAA